MFKSRVIWIGLFGGALLLAGCTESQEPTPSQKQDAILANPMGYKPDVGGDVDGGGTANFDRAGFNKDLNDVLNP
jgi:hypothetical protein